MSRKVVLEAEKTQQAAHWKVPGTRAAEGKIPRLQLQPGLDLTSSALHPAGPFPPPQPGNTFPESLPTP